MRIDAHHHVWDLEVRDQAWTVELPTLRRTFAFDELAPVLRKHDIGATVLVQTVTVREETPEFLRLAEATPEIAGVVGWVDLTGADVDDRLEELRTGPGGEWLVGIRHQVQSEPDPEWLCLLSATYDEVLAATEELTSRLSVDEQADVFGGTAARCYGLAS